MKSTTLPKNISHRWLEQRKSAVEHGMVKTNGDDGSPNPNYLEAKAEVEAAELEIKRWSKFVEWVEEYLGAKTNTYDLKKGYSVVIPAGKGFCRKPHEDNKFANRFTACGKFEGITREDAWKIFLEIHPEGI